MACPWRFVAPVAFRRDCLPSKGFAASGDRLVSMSFHAIASVLRLRAASRPRPYPLPAPASLDCAHGCRAPLRALRVSHAARIVTAHTLHRLTNTSPRRQPSHVSCHPALAPRFAWRSRCFSACVERCAGPNIHSLRRLASVRRMLRHTSGTTRVMLHATRLPSFGRNLFVPVFGASLARVPARRLLQGASLPHVR